MYQHFLKSGHDVKNISIQPVEHVSYDQNATSSFKSKARFISEFILIKNLQTSFPFGLNDNTCIYQSGDISKNPSIDIFSVYYSRIRKSRSHGTRNNGNIKRKARVTISITDLHNIILKSGRHTMLSRLSALPVSSLRNIDDHREEDPPRLSM